jgi:AcrR family transcriptional regulator
MPRSTWWNLPCEKRERVLEAARREFAANGFAAGSLNEIAQRAGVAKGSLFQYFDDKLDLWLTLYQGDCRRVRDRIEQALSESGGLLFFERVRAVVKACLAFYAENPSVCASIDTARREVHPEAHRREHAISAREYLCSLGPFVAQGQASGEVRGHVPPEVIISELVRLCRDTQALVFVEHGDPVLTVEHRSPEEVGELVDVLLDAFERAWATTPDARRRPRQGGKRRIEEARGPAAAGPRRTPPRRRST